MTAKALASKLNERNNMLNGAKKTSSHGAGQSNGTTNDIPIPPLISIQTSSMSGRLKDGDNPHNRDSTLHRSKISQAKKITITDAHSKSSINDKKQQKSETSDKELNGSNSLNHSKLVLKY